MKYMVVLVALGLSACATPKRVAPTELKPVWKTRTNMGVQKLMKCTAYADLGGDEICTSPKVLIGVGSDKQEMSVITIRKHSRGLAGK